MIIRRVAKTPEIKKAQPLCNGENVTVNSSPKGQPENKISYPLKFLNGAFVAAVITFVSFLSPEVGAAIIALLMTKSERDN